MKHLLLIHSKRISWADSFLGPRNQELPAGQTSIPAFVDLNFLAQGRGSGERCLTRKQRNKCDHYR